MADAVQGYYQISDATPKVVGFNTALIFGYHTVFSGVRKYSADTDGLNQMVLDGFSIDSNIYDIAKTLVSQTPHPNEFMIGRSNTLNTETMTLTVVSANAGDKLQVSLGSGAGTIVEVSYTIPPASTPSTAATAFNTAINTGTPQHGVQASVVGAVITLVRTTKPIRLRGFSSNMSFKDNTPAAGYAADLLAANTADKSWYYLLVEGRDAAAIAAAQSFAEANGKIFVGLCADSDCQNSGSTTDVGAIGKVSNLHRNATISSRDRNGNLDAAAVATLAVNEPGTVNLACKDFSGPRVDNWTPAEMSAMDGKNLNYYRYEQGMPWFVNGFAPSGRFIDITTLADKVVQRMKEAHAQVLKRAKKLNFLDSDIAQFDSAQRGVLALEESAKTIVPSGEKDGWTTYVPKRDEVTSTERAQRKLPRLKATFTVSGAVQTVSFSVDIFV